jgi:hypothetical protein
MDKKAKMISEAVMARLDKPIKTLKEETAAVTIVIKEKVTEIADTLNAQITTVVDNTTEETKTVMVKQQLFPNVEYAT